MLTENPGNKEKREIILVEHIEIEDIGLLKMMTEVDRNDKVTREEVMKKLNNTYSKNTANCAP